MREQSVTRHEATASPEVVSQTPAVVPLVDIYENNDEILVLADFPGVGPEDINVRLDKDQIHLEGTRRGDEVGGAARIAGEYRPVSFRRTFVLPRGIDGNRLEAEHRDGVLRLRLPKSEAVRPKRIPVKAS